MSPERKEFIVDFWETGEPGRITVIGRRCDVPIRVGDSFDAVYSYKKVKYPEGLADPPVLDGLLPVSLTVECIHAYERSWEEIGQCMTGSMSLRGIGLEHLAPGWLVGLQSSFPELQASDIDHSSLTGIGN